MNNQFIVKAVYLAQSKKLMLGTTHIGNNGGKKAFWMDDVADLLEARTILIEMGVTTELHIEVLDA